MEGILFFGAAILIFGGIATVVAIIASKEEAEKTRKLRTEFLNRIYGVQGV